MAPALIAALSVAGLPWARWLFALRIWAAVMLALGVAFWLELDGASSAGVCVAILALPTRGQVVEKAIYRMLGTIIGGIASIVITDLFVQTRGLYMVAYSTWLGLCVFAAGFLDGNRAYGAVLCGYTVSIVAIQRIDAPDLVFSAAVNRGAAITVGILAISFVNTVLFIPDITSLVVQRVRSMRESVRGFITSQLHRGRNEATDGEAAQILRTILDRHPELGSLSSETLIGASHAAGTRALAVALVGEVAAARGLATLRLGDDTLARERLLSDLDDCRIAEQGAACALQTGRSLPDAPSMPIYRSWENAFRNGLRAFVASILAGAGFVLTGWPAADLTWSFVGIVICLSANATDPRILARAALIAMPVSAVLAGVTLFVILNGSDAFPLLCLGLFPALVGGALLITSPNPSYAGVGSLTTVFTLVLIGPANPQLYDPSTYVITSTLMILATIIVYVAAFTLFPVEDAERRAWVLRSARRALQATLRGKASLSVPEARLLDASRIGTLSTLTDMPAVRQAADLAILFWLTDLRAAVHRAWFGLDRLCASHLQPNTLLRTAVQAAFCQGDVGTLRQATSLLVTSGHPLARAVAGDIALAARLIDMAPGHGPAEVAAR
jgi:uncharacterized membrane protein YccC